MERYSFPEQVQSAYESLQHPLAIYQLMDGRIEAVVLSEGFCQLFGYADMDEAYYDMNHDMYKDTHPDDVERIIEEARDFMNEKCVYDVIYRTKASCGSGYKVVHAVGKHVHVEGDVHLVHVWYTDEGEYTDNELFEDFHKISREYARLQLENIKLKKEADDSRKIAELKESVTALLTNMPAMTFSKDVVTRKYLACNQAFADYAHKETPDGVVGLTDFEIFDPETAQHFVDDDKKALQMYKPYIFYEDVPDAAGNPRRFQTTKLKFVDDTGRQCLLGLCQDVTEAMQIKNEYVERLNEAQNQVNIDVLTGVKNKHAYQDAEQKLDEAIAKKQSPKFAITILDVNDLKKVNDTVGHQAGDDYICNACKIICKTFDHSPVFRIGGDEFAVISKGSDYEHIENLVDSIAEHNIEATDSGGIVIACGMAKYSGEDCVAAVFTVADKNMYENKKMLKDKKNNI